MDEYFGGSSVTVTHDDNGNLTDDGKLKNTYDAWNRLVKVQFTEDGAAVTVQIAVYDGKGRRPKKVVTNSADHNGTVLYLPDGWKICEPRDGFVKTGDCPN